MKTISEQNIEDTALKTLKGLGYRIIHGPDISPDGQDPERKCYDEVVLVERLKDSICRINPDVPAQAREEAMKMSLRSTSYDLFQNNKIFHKYLTEGIEVEYRVKKRIKGNIVKLLDFENPKQNEFLAVNQFTVIENRKNRRPDIVLFVNGLPIAVIELKSLTNPQATIDSAFRQIQTYHEEIPSLFNYNAFEIISDGKTAKAGTIASPYEWFLPWKTVKGQLQESSGLETMLRGMCDRRAILDIVKNFIAFTKDKKKIVAGYHQYDAARKAVRKTYGATVSDKKIGVVWHTQGSGKSLTMAFYAALINKDARMKNPTIVILTDRNDLDDQLYGAFSLTLHLSGAAKEDQLSGRA